MNCEEKILTIEQAAEILQMTPGQVYELTRRRSQERMEVPFPAIKIHNKAIRIRQSDLFRWIEQLAEQAGVKSQDRGQRA